MQFVRQFLDTLIWALSIAIFLRAIISWFPIDPQNPFVVLLHQITEPILAPLRRVMPRIGMMDITPMVAIILLQVISYIVAVALPTY